MDRGWRACRELAGLPGEIVVILPKIPDGADQLEFQGQYYSREQVLRARIGGHQEMARRRIAEANLLLAEAAKFNELGVKELVELQELKSTL